MEAEWTYSKTGEQMLRVTVELWPGGRESGKRVIATANIGRVKSGAHADYQVQLEEGLIGNVGDTVLVRSYPRWSASLWDLVGRCIAAGLNGGREELPARPALPDVPVHVSDGVRYVRLSEIPQPARTFFECRIDGSTCPYVEEEPDPRDCAYARDWEDFLSGGR
jgi:hypothetical protein